MDLTEYQAAALRTAGHTREYRLRLAVGGMGLSGEAAEVLELIDACPAHAPPDTTKLVKELGDVLWYVAETASTCGLALAEIPVPDPHDDLDTDGALRRMAAIRLVIAAGGTTDYLKKVVGHGHTLDVAKVTLGLGLVLRGVLDLAVLAAVPLGDICAANIKKLEGRYANGFRPEDSINRQPE